MSLLLVVVLLAREESRSVEALVETAEDVLAYEKFSGGRQSSPVDKPVPVRYNKLRLSIRVPL
ncbi:MAG: hypothetical protein KatS3mg022_1956 [Armatimonadota bacterium]|nr:MAG: hypothetical protein KatS3mg022_1956 [Armatimonadota bacterium]